MKFEKSEIKKYRKAKKEIAGIKFILAFTTIALIFHTFKIQPLNLNIDYANWLWIALLPITMRLFLWSPDRVIFDMVESVINANKDNILNANKEPENS